MSEPIEYTRIEKALAQYHIKHQEAMMAKESEQELIESQDKRIAALKAMLAETKQQLAQAQAQIQQMEATHRGMYAICENLDQVIEQMKQERTQAQGEQATMRALLELFAADEAEPVFGLSEEQNDGYECLRCDSYIYSYEPGQFPHAPECPWLRARAFLAAHPTQA